MPHDPHLISALTISGERRSELAAVAGAEHVAVQAATVEALLDGRYDGDLRVGDLLAHGDHGIGTLNGLAGEMVIVDGEAWQARHDGKVVPIPDDARTPFAVVTTIGDADEFHVVRPATNDELLELIDSHLPPGVTNAAVRIDGHFDRIHARSVPKQEPPYRPLSEVAGDMVEWTWEDIRATAVGFRFDSGVEGLEIVGYHLHVLSDDRTSAGHVLGLDLRHGTVRIESLDELHVELPPGVDLTDPDSFEDDGTLGAIENE